MGQAQLLLIVLGVVLVGIAIIAGIQAYSQNAEKANIDARTHDLIRIASDAQLWAQKPEQFGGPATVGDFSTLTWERIGYGGDLVDNNFVNINGIYEMGTPAAGGVIFEATNTQYPDVTVYVAVCGISETDVTAQVGGTAPQCS